jgi:hypothetical protein
MIAACLSLAENYLNLGVTHLFFGDSQPIVKTRTYVRTQLRSGAIWCYSYLRSYSKGSSLPASGVLPSGLERVMGARAPGPPRRARG